jgi:CelD/BcsL family acetyltransferase involved in cellulose biosynthesis
LAEEYLKLLFYQHQKRWEVNKKVSLFSDYQNQEFYIKLTKNLIDTNWLLFSILEFDDQPIAMHYGFDYGNRVYWYKPAFDILFAKHSPGLVLLRYLIEYCIENDKSELDFTIGNEKFKNRYANTFRNNQQINIYQSSARYFYNSSLYQLKSLVKKLDSSENF